MIFHSDTSKTINKAMKNGLLSKSILIYTIYALLFLLIGILRFNHCNLLPINTGDTIRHVWQALLVNQYGLSTAGKPLTEILPQLSWISWSHQPYNYPIIALLFFSFIVWLSPTLFFCKIALTALEAINSYFVYKLSCQRFLSLLYWASPLSIWWVSREGQFEPLQNFFVFLALLSLRAHKHYSVILLALAIQAKVTAIFLLPLFLVEIKKSNQPDLLKALLLFVIGFTPTFIAMFHYPILPQVFLTTQGNL